LDGSGGGALAVVVGGSTANGGAGREDAGICTRRNTGGYAGTLALSTGNGNETSC